MSGEAWKLSKLRAGILVYFIFGLVLLTNQKLAADAYLAEDRIYYGADTYNINYKEEIITAKGNAYFRKGSASVFATRIVIHYGEKEKRAFFFNKVRLLDKETAYELRGDYGEGYFKEDFYIVTGNVMFIDREKRILAGRAETKSLDDFYFTEKVTYSDESVIIRSQSLDLSKDDSALFKDDVHTVFLKNGDELYCRTLTHFFETGNDEFRDDVIYIQRESSNEDEEPLIIKAELVQYNHDDDFFLLMDGVYATDGSYSLKGLMVKYFRDQQVLESIGSTVIHDGQRTIYCDRLFLNVAEGEITFFNSIQGVFDVE
jgi:lipopolysaccharide assembly outer membrane protein LptD (OstA)